MTSDQIIERLQVVGTAQGRKIYVRHGAHLDKVFGVSFAEIG